MGARLAALALAVAVTAAACGARPGMPSDVAALARERVTIEIDWRTPLVEPTMFTLGHEERGGVAVSEDGARVFATLSTGELVALDAMNGAVLWRVAFDDEPFTAPPTVFDGALYVAAGIGDVVALSFESGEVLWRARLQDAFRSAPTVTNDRVYVVGARGSVYALARDTGRSLWAFEHRARLAVTVAGSGQVTVDDDGVALAGFPDGVLAAIGPGGEGLWLSDLTAGTQRLRDVDTTPMLAGTRVIAGSFSGGLFALDRRSGQREWHTEISGSTSPLRVGDDQFVTTTSDSRVLWLDLSDGAIVGELKLDSEAPGPAVAAGRFLLVPTPLSGIYLCERSRPWIHTRFDHGGGFTAPPVVADGAIYVLSNGGHVYRLHARAL